MKSFKKALVMLLVLALVLGTMATGFAAAPSDVTGTKYEAAVDHLIKLGVVNGYPDGTYKPGNIVTRAEMAKLVVVAMGLKDAADAVKANTIFSDVKADHWASGYINVATNLGILKGYPDGTFKPENTVTYAEAVTMLLRALGYKDDKLAGTWPTNFIVKAASLGVTSGVTMVPNSGAIRGDIAMLVYNTLKQNKVEYDKDGNLIEKDTLLKDLADTKEYVILATHDVDPNVDEGYVSVKEVKSDGTLANSPDIKTQIDLNAYLGKDVKVFVNSDDEIIAVDKVVTTDVKTFTISANDQFVAGSTYEFKDVSIKVGDIPVVLDGIKTTMSKVSNLIGKNTEVSLINNNGGTDYDYAVITKAAGGQYLTISPYVVNSDVASNAKFIDGKYAIYDGNDTTKPYKVFGAVSKATDIKKGDVIYYITVTKADGNTTKVIYVVRNSITGTVSQVRTLSDGTKKATINGTEYTVNTSDTINSGDQGTATLDKDNKIIKWDVTSAATVKNYALVLSKQSWNDAWNTKVKLYKPDGTKAEYDIVYDNVYNGDKDGKVNSTIQVGDIVTYKLDSNGKIKEMKKVIAADTTAINGSAVPFDNDSAKKVITVNGTVYQYGDATVFNIVYDSAKGFTELHSVNIADIKDGNYVKYALTSKDGNVLDLLVFANSDISKSYVSTQETKPLVYVDSKSDVTLSDGTEYTTLDVIENGIAKTYDGTDTFTVSDDHVYVLTVGTDGKVTDVYALTEPGNDDYAVDETVYGNVYIADNLIKFGNTPGSNTTVKVLDSNVVVIDATDPDDVQVVGLQSIGENAKMDVYIDKATDRVVLIVLR